MTTYPYSFMELSQDCYDYFFSLNTEEAFNNSWIADEITYEEFQPLYEEFLSKLGHTPGYGCGLYLILDGSSWLPDFYVEEMLLDNDDVCSEMVKGGSYNVIYSSTQVAYGPY